MALSKKSIEELLISIDEGEIVSWLEHPCTVLLKRFIEYELGDLKDSWLNGAFTGEGGAETVQLNARALGIGQGQDSVLTTIENLIHMRKEIINDNPNRT